MNTRFASPPVDRRRFLQVAGLGTLVVTTAACGGFAGRSEGEAATDGILMTGWGSDVEKEHVRSAVDGFVKGGKNRKVTYQFIPNDGYEAKMNTLVAAGDLPDLSYQSEGLAMRLASQGRLANILDYEDEYPQIGDMLPTVVHRWAPGKAITQLAVEMMMMWYNAEAIKEAGVPTPPAVAGKAWSWDAFVGYCEKLTVDREGRHPTESGFDPKAVKQWGTLAPTGWPQFYPLLRSNGADIVDETGKRCVLDSAAAVDVVSDIHDLIYEHHVAPTPAQFKTFAATFTADLLENRRVATVLDGQWNLLDLGQMKLDYGVGVLPRFEEPKTVNLCNAVVVSAKSKKVDLAIELMLHLADPTKNDLYAKGLWMPLGKKYYTDPKAVASWTDNPVHPKEFKTAALDYLVECGEEEPAYKIKNWDQINNILTAEMDGLFASAKGGKAVVRAAMQKAKKRIDPLLRGVYPSA
ncbi:MAG: extracellular solute-binding protein [Streptosporangiales bacterium]|nr:extracellular solute-binding protein [Streptosporangiales bacterium]